MHWTRYYGRRYHMLMVSVHWTSFLIGFYALSRNYWLVYLGPLCVEFRRGDGIPF